MKSKKGLIPIFMKISPNDFKPCCIIIKQSSVCSSDTIHSLSAKLVGFEQSCLTLDLKKYRKKETTEDDIVTVQHIKR